MEQELRTKLGFRDTSSKHLIDTEVRAGESPRAFYLRNPAKCPGPLVSHSKFVPPVMVEHLMRNKKDSALGVKFVESNNPPDAVTNMEAAFHTYITPILSVIIHGDYRFRGHHGMLRYTNDEDYQRARQVVLSAAVQPDFEDEDVMLTLMCLQEEEILGSFLPNDFAVLDTGSKQHESRRMQYESKLREHLIACLMKKSRLPPLREVESEAMDVEECCKILESIITTTDPLHCQEAVERKFVKLRYGDIISLQMLCRSTECQARNEIVALEQLCPQGYIYTVDPPSIFAREIGAKLLNRCQFLALKHLTTYLTIEKMKIFAFNDYADRHATEILRHTFGSMAIKVMSKSQIFSGPEGAYRVQEDAEDAILVIHNNSDGFGQNIETEPAGGSLDGAIGFHSSAAASLLRTRMDLTIHKLAI